MNAKRRKVHFLSGSGEAKTISSKIIMSDGDIPGKKKGGEESGRCFVTDSACNGTTLRYINWEGRQTSFTGSHYALMLRHTLASLLATRASHQHSKLKQHLTGTMDGQHKDRRQTHLWILTLLILV